MSIALEHVNYVYSPGTAYEKHGDVGEDPV